jgi:hypothetical protein
VGSVRRGDGRAGHPPPYRGERRAARSPWLTVVAVTVVRGWADGVGAATGFRGRGSRALCCVQRPFFTSHNFCCPPTEVLWWSRARGANLADRRNKSGTVVPRPRESVVPRTGKQRPGIAGRAQSVSRATTAAPRPRKSLGFHAGRVQASPARVEPNPWRGRLRRTPRATSPLPLKPRRLVPRGADVEAIRFQRPARESGYAVSSRNPLGLTTPPPHLLHSHRPRWPVGRLLVPRMCGTNSTADPTRWVMT